MTITIGLNAEQSTTVTESLSAQTFGSGTLPVYATPALVALMETAAINAIHPLLLEHQTSVGTFISIKHLAASALGQTIRARAEVTAVEGNQITFSVQAWDTKQLIGEGTHTRFIIDIERFMKRLTS
ncbi:MAG: thioesterase family protein [Chloroflexota bacterium]